MFRIQGHLLRDQWSIWIELTKVYGIWRTTSKKILTDLGIPLEKKVRDLDEKEVSDEVQKEDMERELKEICPRNMHSEFFEGLVVIHKKNLKLWTKVSQSWMIRPGNLASSL